MCDPVTAAVIGVVGSAFSASKQAKAAGKAADAQTQASDQATATARETAATNKVAAEKSAFDADVAMNRANGKQPDVGGLYSRNAMDAKGGASGTMLTGPQGVDPKTLLLGKTTLLGG